MMSDRFRNDLGVINPFDFKYVQNLRNLAQFNDVGPSVVFASPGMLQSGPSRELFEKWCPEKKNGTLIFHYIFFFFPNEIFTFLWHHYMAAQHRNFLLTCF